MVDINGIIDGQLYGFTNARTNNYLFLHETVNITSGNSIITVFNYNQKFGYYAYQDSAQDLDTFWLCFFVNPGTYKLIFTGISDTDCGIIDWYLDSTSNTPIISGQDWYSSSRTFNTVKTTTDIVINNDELVAVYYDRHKLFGKVNGKNSSSTDYKIKLTSYQLVRTS